MSCASRIDDVRRRSTAPPRAARGGRRAARRDRDPSTGPETRPRPPPQPPPRPPPARAVRRAPHVRAPRPHHGGRDEPPVVRALDRLPQGRNQPRQVGPSGGEGDLLPHHGPQQQLPSVEGARYPHAGSRPDRRRQRRVLPTGVRRPPPRPCRGRAAPVCGISSAGRRSAERSDATTTSPVREREVQRPRRPDPPASARHRIPAVRPTARHPRPRGRRGTTSSRPGRTAPAAPAARTPVSPLSSRQARVS